MYLLGDRLKYTRREVIPSVEEKLGSTRTKSAVKSTFAEQEFVPRILLSLLSEGLTAKPTGLIFEDPALQFTLLRLRDELKITQLTFAVRIKKVLGLM